MFWQESCHSFNVLYLELVERPLDARSASSFACGEIGIDEDETLSLPFDAGTIGPWSCIYLCIPPMIDKLVYEFDDPYSPGSQMAE